MHPATACATRAVVLIAAFSLLTGCSARSQANFGIRPDPTEFSDQTKACERFADVVNFSGDLQEAYHSRATQNRWWIYVAGTLALGTAAATGGLAAAGGATLSIALLSISGGFSSGFFAFLDNAELADVYTISANELAEGIRDAQAEIKYGTDDKPSPDSCEKALRVIEKRMTKAQTELEIARTSTAAAAIVRAQAELKKLEELNKKIVDDSLRKAVAGGRIIEIQWTKGQKAVAKVTGADLSKVNLGDFMVKVGETSVRPYSITTDAEQVYLIAFEPPEEPAGASDKGREVSLVFPSADASIPSLPDVRLKAPAAAA